jgi:hypothetical protein
MDVLTLRNSTAYPFYSDLATVQAVHASGQVAQLCTGLLFGHNPQLTLPGGLRTTFAALRAKLNESFAGVMFVRQRAGEFIRQLDVAANR